MSTLVETVSIDCANFQDSFLTCSTCLCGYDASSRSPKLLPCTHTVCLCCLEKMVAQPGGGTALQFSCPSCRYIVQVPSDGVSLLPPSFLVNQLLDLLNQESRRDMVPHCAVQISHGELLLCETCDVVFCSSCTDPDLITSGDATDSSNHSNSSRHTVIPFGVAIKRMSEILLYKEYNCKRNLDQAAEAVDTEIKAVDRSTRDVVQQIEESFNDLQTMIEERKCDLQRDLQYIADDKRRKLRGQLQIIDTERKTITHHTNITIRADITKQISALNDKLDIWRTLSSPRDNAYIRFDVNRLTPLRTAFDSFGKLHISSTFPAMSNIKMVDSLPLPTHLGARVTLQTIDYNGEKRTIGDDPIRAELSLVDEDHLLIDCKVVDHANGQYSIMFTPTQTKRHRLNVKIFDRSIDGSPLNIEITHHHRPVLTIGEEAGSQRAYNTMKPGRESSFTQPVAVAMGRHEGQYIRMSTLRTLSSPLHDMPQEVLYILDSGRAKVIVCNTFSGDIINVINLPTTDAAYTGLATTRLGNLVVVNWRLKKVIIMSPTGDILVTVESIHFKEPTVVCSSTDQDEIYVGDNCAGAIFVLNSIDGTSLRTIKSKDVSLFKQITALCCYKEKLIIADGSRMRIYTLDGAFIRTLDAPNARYSGLSIDNQGICLAVRVERVAGIAVRVFKPLSELLDKRSLSEQPKFGRTLPRGESFSLNTSKRMTQTLPISACPPSSESESEHVYDIDSEGARLKRPAGVTVSNDGHIYVCDLGNQCVRKYRYI